MNPPEGRTRPCFPHHPRGRPRAGPSPAPPQPPGPSARPVPQPARSPRLRTLTGPRPALCPPPAATAAEYRRFATSRPSPPPPRLALHPQSPPGAASPAAPSVAGSTRRRRKKRRQRSSQTQAAAGAAMLAKAPRAAGGQVTSGALKGQRRVREGTEAGARSPHRPSRLHPGEVVRAPEGEPGCCRLVRPPQGHPPHTHPRPAPQESRQEQMCGSAPPGRAGPVLPHGERSDTCRVSVVSPTGM